jgi:2-dehydropantoate 2-reductase
MNVLIVGAGAVGASFAAALQRGGARVSFFVRPGRVEQVREGLTLHELRLARAPRSHVLHAHEVLSTPDEVAQRAFDQVWLAVPSDALDGEWLGALCGATGDATVVVLQPGLDDRAKVAAAAGDERVVAGTIVLVAWPAPLPGELLAPGTASWFPPLVPTPLSGPRAASVRDALRRGGVRARVVDDASADTASIGALMQTLIAALECEGWSLARLVRSSRLSLALRAARQASAVAAVAHGRRAPLVVRLVQPWLVRVARPFARLVFPTDLETYARVHFTKVRAQTTKALDEYVERASELPVDAIEALRDDLRDARSAVGPAT